MTALHFAREVRRIKRYPMSKKLGCYDKGLQDFEKQYERPLKRVSAEEMRQKIKQACSNEEKRILLFRSCLRLAQAIIAEIS